MEYIAIAIDRCLEHRVLIFGSIPPHGRDLDLLVRPEDESTIRAQLLETDFARREYVWARFSNTATQIVDLIPTATWHLPDNEANALFNESRPLDGFRFLVQPSHHHVLLIAARRIAASGGTLSPTALERVNQALASDKAAWVKANERAHAWHAVTSLKMLEEHVQTRSRTSRLGKLQLRATARLERLAAVPTTREKMKMATKQLSSRIPRFGVIIALSGLDGAGKSTLSKHLKESLSSTGIDVAVEWTPAYNPALKIPVPIKKLILRAMNRRRSKDSNSTTQPQATKLTGDDVLKEQKRGVKIFLSTIAATAGAVGMWLATARHLFKGRVVICDRFVLDSAVNLRYRYQSPRRHSFQIALLRSLSPSPLRAYLLEIPGELAWKRKKDQYSAAELTEQAQLYRAEADLLDVHRLDGTLSVATLSAKIADDLWSNLD